MNREQQLKLQAFLDGELPEREKRAVLLWLQDNEEAAALLAELRNTRQAIVKSKPHLSLPESREFFWSQIEREIQRLEPEKSATPEVSIFNALRRWFFPAVAVSALALAGLIAHFNVPKAAVEIVADADMPTVETTLASGDATTYRNASDGITLVWFSDNTPIKSKSPATIN